VTTFVGIIVFPEQCSVLPGSLSWTESTTPFIYTVVFWRKPCSLVVAFNFSVLKMETVCSFRYFVLAYQAVWWHSPEDVIKYDLSLSEI